MSPYGPVMSDTFWLRVTEELTHRLHKRPWPQLTLDDFADGLSTSDQVTGQTSRVSSGLWQYREAVSDGLNTGHCDTNISPRTKQEM
ncbi:hypothetical protein RRG08_006587 [Elysia crispata]|uniref:Uncharacterized protein n=1 Tax=Elysia crispata TaxID=231223 RepID=A0AAE1CX14_9GAST|nr:hypothetical protein RRG08_006587 [Elysia crispata]